jgi:hypothetical protein
VLRYVVIPTSSIEQPFLLDFMTAHNHNNQHLHELTRTTYYKHIVFVIICISVTKQQQDNTALNTK